ncbi:MAG: site-2 protease family protein [Caldilineaceae bacterium]
MSEPTKERQLFPFGEIDPNAAQLLADEVRTLVVGDMRIDSVQIGRDQRREGAVIVRGHLLQPSDVVFPRWLEALKRRNCTPMLRHDPEGDAEAVILRVMIGSVTPPPGKPWLNALLFVLTVLSTLIVGVTYRDDFTANLRSIGDLFLPQVFIHGWPFAVSLMGILLAHEFGHYFAARYHKLAVSLPFFIPLPIPGGFSPGTMGAFIRLKALVPDRRKLFDVGVAGPLAGVVIAIPLLLIGLSTSVVKTPPAGGAYYVEGNSLLYIAAKYIMFGKFLPNAVTGEDVFINSVTAAAWFGLLVTALNLLPVGQLDGGHTVFALFGEGAKRLNQIVAVVLALLGLASLGPIQRIFPWLASVGYEGWFIWLALIFFVVGPYHPPALDDVTRLDPTRRWIGYLVIAIFILTFVPVPVRIVGM